MAKRAITRAILSEASPSNTSSSKTFATAPHSKDACSFGLASTTTTKTETDTDTKDKGKRQRQVQRQGQKQKGKIRVRGIPVKERRQNHGRKPNRLKPAGKSQQAKVSSKLFHTVAYVRSAQQSGSCHLPYLDTITKKKKKHHRVVYQVMTSSRMHVVHSSRRLKNILHYCCATRVRPFTAYAAPRSPPQASKQASEPGSAERPAPPKKMPCHRGGRGAPRQRAGRSSSGGSLIRRTHSGRRIFRERENKNKCTAVYGTDVCMHICRCTSIKYLCTSGNSLCKQ